MTGKYITLPMLFFQSSLSVKTKFLVCVNKSMKVYANEKFQIQLLAKCLQMCVHTIDKTLSIIILRAFFSNIVLQKEQSVYRKKVRNWCC